MGEVDARPEGQRSLWIPGGLAARYPEGSSFPAEATLSRFEVRRRTFYTLILRNVDDRLRAERQIHTLAAQTEYLREEIKGDHDFEEIVGQSARITEILRDVQRVAATDATRCSSRARRARARSSSPAPSTRRAAAATGR